MLLAILQTAPVLCENPFYLCGNAFREYADFIIDETDASLVPEELKCGNTVFVKTDYLYDFFTRVHPRISCGYILITHNSDLAIPGPFAEMLNEETLIAWFGQNVENYSHPKLHAIPIGIANPCWPHGNTAVLEDARIALSQMRKEMVLYMNFALETNYQERSQVYRHFIREPFCLFSAPKDFRSYLTDLAQSQFVLSPRGNGLDCHRTWEALYMGAIPIVKTSTLDGLYEGLPVVIIDDWEEVTEAFLEQKYAQMKAKSYVWDKVSASYWFDVIDSFKK